MKSNFSIILFGFVGVCILLAALFFNRSQVGHSNTGGLNDPVQTLEVDSLVDNQTKAATPIAQSISLASTTQLVAPAELTPELEKTNAQITEQLEALEELQILQAELIKTLGQIKEEFSQTNTQLQKSNAKVEALALREQNLLAKTSILNADLVSSNSFVSKIDSDLGIFTIQLASLESVAKVKSFIDSTEGLANLENVFYYYLSTKQAKPWYLALYGVYKSKGQAVLALAELPKSLKARSPIIRQMKANSESMIKYPQ